jgi:hypothetical protein
MKSHYLQIPLKSSLSWPSRRRVISKTGVCVCRQQDDAAWLASRVILIWREQRGTQQRHGSPLRHLQLPQRRQSGVTAHPRPVCRLRPRPPRPPSGPGLGSRGSQCSLIRPSPPDLPREAGRTARSQRGRGGDRGRGRACPRTPQTTAHSGRVQLVVPVSRGAFHLSGLHRGAHEFK